MSEIKEQKNPTEMCWNKPGPLVSYGIPYKSKYRRIENNSLKQIPGFWCEQPYSKSFIKHYIVIIYSRFFWLDAIFLFTFPEALLRVRTSTLSKCHPAKRPALSWPILSFVSSPTSSSWKDKHHIWISKGKHCLLNVISAAINLEYKGIARWTMHVIQILWNIVFKEQWVNIESAQNWTYM